MAIAAHALLSASVMAINQSADGWVLALPKRRAATPPPAVPLPLPPQANQITPATIRVAIQRGRARERQPVRQTVTRTPERIHMIREDGGEWFFERNPVDPRRVSAASVEHRSREIVLYEESDLRMAMGIRGWTDVLALGFDQAQLSHYRRTSETRPVGGISFTRYTAGRGQTAGDIWWNADAQLASRFAVTDRYGAAHFAIESISSRIDEAVLQPPAHRFPTYAVTNVGDWLEHH